jgi:hypothetical protein
MYTIPRQSFGKIEVSQSFAQLRFPHSRGIRSPQPTSSLHNFAVYGYYAYANFSPTHRPPSGRGLTIVRYSHTGQSRARLPNPTRFVYLHHAHVCAPAPCWPCVLACLCYFALPIAIPFPTSLRTGLIHIYIQQRAETGGQTERGLTVVSQGVHCGFHCPSGVIGCP